jgi:L-iditol 2-dehydrogenase
VGDRAVVTHHVPCNTCRYCLRGHHTACDSLRTTNVDPGGFAEYIRIPGINVDRGMLPLPDDMTYEEGTFVEPLGCVVRGQRLSGLETGDRVLVLGCGVAGILHIQLARSRGCPVTGVDVVERRIEFARRFGASQAFTPDEMDPDSRYDQVIVCTTARSAAETALRHVDRGGSVLFFAPTLPGVTVPLDVAAIWRDEVRILTSYAAAPADLATAMALIHQGVINVRDMITHVLDLDDIQRAFEIASSPDEGLKVILRPFHL